MTRQSGPRLPSRVTLPDQPMLPAWHVRMVVGASKSLLCLWRKQNGFPASHRQGVDAFTSTAALADWLRSHGVAVQIVSVSP